MSSKDDWKILPVDELWNLFISEITKNQGYKKDESYKYARFGIELPFDIELYFTGMGIASKPKSNRTRIGGKWFRDSDILTEIHDRRAIIVSWLEENLDNGTGYAGTRRRE